MARSCECSGRGAWAVKAGSLWTVGLVLPCSSTEPSDDRSSRDPDAAHDHEGHAHIRAHLRLPARVRIGDPSTQRREAVVLQIEECPCDQNQDAQHFDGGRDPVSVSAHEFLESFLITLAHDADGLAPSPSR